MPTTPGAVNVAIVDDHDLVRDGLALLLRTVPDLEVTWSGRSIEPLIAQSAAIREQVDIVLLDVRLADSKVTTTQVAALVAHGVPVVLLTAYANDPHVLALITAGAAGVVAKREDREELVTAIRQALANGSLTNADTLAAFASTSPDGIGLANQERRVLMLYAGGLKIDEVAGELGISPNTVKDYLRRIRRKLTDAGMPGPTQVSLHRRARELGLID